MAHFFHLESSSTCTFRGLTGPNNTSLCYNELINKLGRTRSMIAYQISDRLTWWQSWISAGIDRIVWSILSAYCYNSEHYDIYVTVGLDFSLLLILVYCIVTIFTISRWNNRDISICLYCVRRKAFIDRSMGVIVEWCHRRRLRIIRSDLHAAAYCAHLSAVTLQI